MTQVLNRETYKNVLGSKETKRRQKESAVAGQAPALHIRLRARELIIIILRLGGSRIATYIDDDDSSRVFLLRWYPPVPSINYLRKS